jgi:shikimate dehydrogenase
VHGPADSMVERLRGLLVRPSAAGEADAARTVIGLVGRGIQLSRSPRMHEAEGARLGLRYAYVLIDFDELGLPNTALEDVVAAAARAGFAGLNVTHPFKQSIIASLYRLSPEAAAIGAVNTVVLAGGARTGHNTDSWGFAESFREGMAGCALDRVALFGAGGAGAAVAHALLGLGTGQLTVVDPDVRRAERLVERLCAQGARVRHGDDVAAVVAETDGIVNATPVGMAKYPGTPLPVALLEPRHWVADIIYFPQETELLRGARARGCRTLPGTGMAVWQAVRAFELFTGLAPDPRAMVRHFEAAA